MIKNQYPLHLSYVLQVALCIPDVCPLRGEKHNVDISKESSVYQILYVNLYSILLLSFSILLYPNVSMLPGPFVLLHCEFSVGLHVPVLELGTK